MYLTAFNTSISRSISQCESNVDAAVASTSSTVFAVSSTGTTGTLPSFSGASYASATSCIGCGIDKVDGDAVANASHVTATGTASGNRSASAVMLAFKERTMSITLASEDDDEPVSLLSDRCRYISVSEEDENALAELVAATMTTSAVTAATTSSTSTTSSSLATSTNLQQTTVITEQPTATASKLELDLMLASADINNTTKQNTTTLNDQDNANEGEGDDNEDGNETIMTNTITTSMSSVGPDVSVGGDIYMGVMQTPQIVVAGPTTPQQSTTTAAIFITPSSTEMTDTSSPSIPTSFGTTSEDSDEYRSLEPKDDADFPISE